MFIKKTKVHGELILATFSYCEANSLNKKAAKIKKTNFCHQSSKYRSGFRLFFLLWRKKPFWYSSGAFNFSDILL